MSEIIRIEALRKSMHGKPLLDIECLEIHPHRCVALSGRNGAGKSTLMRIIAGLEMPEHALIVLGGEHLTWRQARQRLRTRVIYLHQQPYLFDRTVSENVAFGLQSRKLPLPDISARVAAALDWAGIGHLQMRNARELSGGERQRVAFARARILSPDLLLLDEPTANMDSEGREQAYRMIRRLKADGVSILLATHEFHTVAQLCDAHLSLENGRLESRPLDGKGMERKLVPCG